MQRTVQIALILVVAVVGVLGYLHWSKTRALNSGAVHVRPQAADTGKAAPETAAANQPAETASEAQNSDQGQPQGVQSSVYTLPASDAISRNPGDRTILAGTGRYQLYRQGDITWRMDTASGQACVLFATEAMWRRTLVYQHGCGASN
jgi:hypothetical protein